MKQIPRLCWSKEWAQIYANVEDVVGERNLDQVWAAVREKVRVRVGNRITLFIYTRIKRGK